MRSRLKNRLKILLLFFSLLLIVIPICIHREKSDVSGRFRTFADDLFRQEMLANTLNMHYTISDTARFGISSYEPVLPPYSSATPKDYQEIMDTLDTFDDTKLTDSERRLKELLSKHLSLSKELAAFPLYDDPLSPHSGVQAKLPSLFADYPFRSLRDVEDYLALLSQIPDYLDSVISFQEQKNAAGFLMPESSRKILVNQCRTILSKRELKEGSHFLQTSFDERIADLAKQGAIDAETVSQLADRNTTVLCNQLLPAYQSLAAYLQNIPTDSGKPSGLSSLPDGQHFYELKLKNEVGASMSVSKLRSVLEEQFRIERTALKELYTKNPFLSALSEEEIPFPLTSYEEMLSDLKQRMADAFPSIDRTNATVRDVSPSLTPYSAPAYYMTAPIDDIDHNTIYVNPEKTCPGLELYTTLAHEGYPGHLYQNAYTCRRLMSAECSPAEALLWYGGYLEGWAMYTEFLSFDFAADLYREHDLPAEAVFAQIEKHNRSLQLCLYSILDIMIHYDGAALSDISEYLSELGIHDTSAIEEVYLYICAEPCNYLKYYAGCLEFLALKNRAQVLWADDYSDLRFHTFCLDQGPADFETLQYLLEETATKTNF